MLRDRLRTSAILIAIVLVLLTLDYSIRIPGAEGIWLLPLLLFFAIGTAVEIATMLANANHPIRRAAAVSGATMIALSAAIPYLWSLPRLWSLESPEYPPDCPIGRLGWIVLASSSAAFLVLITEMWHYGKTTSERPGDAIRRTCSGLFVSIYVGIPMAMLIALRGLHAGTTAGRFGLAALVTTIIVTKVADAGAYFSGRALGRHKLIPRLSPGKTIEGAIGGVVASTLVALGCLEYLFPALIGSDVTGESVTTPISEKVAKTGISALLATPWVGALVLGPLLAVTGMVGDLAESLFKRDSGVKDSGNLLPGLGGVWDVTDSLLAASMPAFFCFAAGVGGQ